MVELIARLVEQSAHDISMVGALMINGKPWRGHRNTAGELGHIITHADGVLCGCGAKGCYESYASAPALVRMGGVKKAVKEIQPRFDEGACRICLAMYHNEAGMRGAAALAKMNLM